MILKKISRNKKGLSPVVATVVLIGIAVAMVTIVLGIVKPFAEDRLDESKRCYDVLGKVEFNYQYTCYNSSNNTMVISISQKDVDLDGMIIVLNEENGTYSESFKLNNITGDPYKIPGPESGKRYFLNEVDFFPSYIAVAPIVEGKGCDVSDETYNVVTCSQ